MSWILFRSYKSFSVIYTFTKYLITSKRNYGGWLEPGTDIFTLNIFFDYHRKRKYHFGIPTLYCVFSGLVF
jgi:hypothetical protein